MERTVKKMGTRKYFPLGKEKGERENEKTTKREIWKDESKAKKWWKKDERKNGKIQSDKHNTGVFCNEITKWSKWKIHKKETKNREWIKEEKKNNQETEKKRRSPEKTFKKKIFFQTQKK